MAKKLDTNPYKGVRDFYPEDMWVEKYLFRIMREVVERFGYIEYGASPLEPSELYKEKSGEEIVNEQTYSFTDRGNREVTLRPEMTPTVARMVAGRKRDLPFPLRWYSIPNLFRYESPQRGRLREHYQLNVDVFGISNIEGEIEVISIAHSIMKAFGASEGDFSILINSRKLMKALFESYELNDEDSLILSKLLDKKEKVDKKIFEESVEKILKDKTSEFLLLLTSHDKLLDKVGKDHPATTTLIGLIESLDKLGIKNIAFTPTLMRGFDYYTDIVFEVFDNHPDNNRSLFGGGRYDSLLELFSNDSLPAIGFGMGDVTIRDFLETHNLLPKYRPETNALLATIGTIDRDQVLELTQRLRNGGVSVALNTIAKKPADAIKGALKLGIPYIIFVGEDELTNKIYTLKNLTTESTESLSEEELIKKIQS